MLHTLRCRDLPSLNLLQHEDSSVFLEMHARTAYTTPMHLLNVCLLLQAGSRDNGHASRLTDVGNVICDTQRAESRALWGGWWSGIASTRHRCVCAAGGAAGRISAAECWHTRAEQSTQQCMIRSLRMLASCFIDALMQHCSNGTCGQVAMLPNGCHVK